MNNIKDLMQVQFSYCVHEVEDLPYNNQGKMNQSLIILLNKSKEGQKKSLK